jgi:hypothetical protein
MKSAAVKARPGDKIRLSKIDPDDTGGISKKEVCTRFVDLPEEISLLQEKLDRSLRARFGILPFVLAFRMRHFRKAVFSAA